MRLYIIIGLFIVLATSATAQIRIEGLVTSTNNRVLRGASVQWSVSGNSTQTDSKGRFVIPYQRLPDTLVVTYIGYDTLFYAVDNPMDEVQLELTPAGQLLEEVTVQTGYYTVPKERATGSFTHIDQQLLNRSTGSNLLERLEGIAGSLQFIRNGLEGEDTQGTPALRIRGLSTIDGDTRPLIVLDNFPYESDLSAINPNDVASVTLLKDAAAASIWGARAGNGVIVITTKKGGYGGKTRFSFTANTGIVAKPRLHYNPNYLAPDVVMGIQRELFDQNAYPENDHTTLPLYVELLIAKRDGKIAATQFAAEEGLMQQTDLRDQALSHLYRVGATQQYAVNVQGGGDKHSYYISGGYDRESSTIIGKGNDRLNLTMKNTFRLGKGIEVSGGIHYASYRVRNGGITFSELGTLNPYARLVDGEGNALPLTRTNIRLAYQQDAEENGLLDWQYRPVDEVNMIEKMSHRGELRFTGGISYLFLENVRLSGSYQYADDKSAGQERYDPESYFARNEVNRFTQANGTKIIPEGGALFNQPERRMRTHMGRLQADYHGRIADDHELTVLAGAEMSETGIHIQPQLSLWGYDPELGTGYVPYNFTNMFYTTRPSGFGQVQKPYTPPTTMTGRNLSYFGNASYSYRGTYILSSSLRWDGSNLLGAKTNQRGTALWSVGGSWEVSKESFYRSSAVPYLRFRATYGSSGNIDKTQSHFPTIDLRTDVLSDLTIATLQHPGNPSLRWEQVDMMNAGVDFQTRTARVRGSLEWYGKYAKHLLSDLLIDPTIGVSSNYKENYANLMTQGFDLNVQTVNTQGKVRWESTFLLSYTANQVKKVYTKEDATIHRYFTDPPFVVGKSRDLLYSIPWAGLNPMDGQPLVYMDGQPSPTSDYSGFFDSLKLADLEVSGVTAAPFFGSLRNQLRWKALEVGFLLTFNAGHVFRRNSMMPDGEFRNITTAPRYHRDYLKRWERPGDENDTHVPSKRNDLSEQRNWIYQYAAVLVSPASVLRLQDVRAAYKFNRFRLYGYVRNLGIIWRENKEKIDPDFPNAAYPAPLSISIGIQVDL